MAKLKYSDDELSKQMLDIQNKNPMFTLSMICKELKVDRDYINDRSKKNEALKVPEEEKVVVRAKKRCQAIRESAWTAEGIANLKNKDYNTVMFIWMTRNIMGWSDRAAFMPLGIGASGDEKTGTLVLDFGAGTKKGVKK